jgi:excisionase family DNA binding protein
MPLPSVKEDPEGVKEAEMVNGRVRRHIDQNVIDPDADDEWFGVDQVAQHINKSQRFVRRLVAERRLRYYKHGSLLAFKRSDVDAWAIAECREPTQ